LKLESLSPEQVDKLTGLNIREAAHLAAVLQLEGSRRALMEQLGLGEEGLASLCAELEAAGLSPALQEPEEWPPMGCFDEPSDAEQPTEDSEPDPNDGSAT